MKNILSPRNFRFVVIAFSVYGMFFLGKGIFYFFFPKQEVVVPVKMMEEIDRSFNEMKKNLNFQIDQLKYSFESAMNIDPEKIKPYVAKSDSVSKFFQQIRITILQSKNYLPLNTGNAKGIMNIITITKTKLEGLEKDSLRKIYFKKALLSSNIYNEKEYSEKSMSKYFNSIADSLAPIYLNKMIIDSYQDELRLKEYFLGMLGCVRDVRIDKINSIVVSSDNIVRLGDEYSAKIFLAAWSASAITKVLIGELNSFAEKDDSGSFLSTKMNPVINGKKLDKEFGCGKYFITPNKIGKYNYSGAIESHNPDGSPIYFPFEAEYEVIPKTP